MSTVDGVDQAMLPLADISILAVEQYGAGPWGSVQLADLGAEVIKIEDPVSGGDVGRYVPPYREGEDSLFFETFNRNKQSISLNLRSEAGRESFEALVKNTDAVYCNLRGDLPAKLGLDYEHLGKLNPQIVCCSLSGYGTTGPLAATPAYDYVIQGRAGWMSLTGDPQGEPQKTGLSLVDFAGGYVAALTLLAAVWRARRDGVGCDCDVSLFETALSLLTYIGTWTATADYEAKRTPHSAHPSIVPFQVFPTADGHVVIACAKDKFWRLLCEAIERNDLLEDEGLATMAGRYENRDELTTELIATFAERGSNAWLERLTAAGVPCAPVNDVATALNDEQVLARDGIVEIDHPELGKVRQFATPLRLSGVETPKRRAPKRGEHTERVLREIGGLDHERIADLESRGAFNA